MCSFFWRTNNAFAQVAPAESDKADELARQLELDEQNERRSVVCSSVISISRLAHRRQRRLPITNAFVLCSQLQIFDSNNDAELQQARATKNQTVSVC